MRCTKPGWWVALAALVALAATAAGQVADGAPLALEVQLWQTRLSAEAGGKLPADAPATLAALRSRAEDAATAAEQAAAATLAAASQLPAGDPALADAVARADADRKAAHQARRTASTAAQLEVDLTEHSRLSTLLAELTRLEASLAGAAGDLDALTRRHERATTLRAQLTRRLTSLETERGRLLTSLETLLPAADVEPEEQAEGEAIAAPATPTGAEWRARLESQPTVLVNRAEQLLARRAANNRWQGEYRLALLRTDDLLTSLSRDIGEESAAALLHRGPHLLAAVGTALREPGLWTETAAAVAAGSALSVIRHEPWRVVLLFLLTLAAIGVGWFAAGRLTAQASRLEPEGFGALLAQSLLLAFARHLPAAAGLLTAGALLTAYGTQPGRTPFLALLCYALALFVGLRVLNRALLAPYPPAEPPADLPPELRGTLARRLGQLILVGVLAYLLWRLGEEYALRPAVLDLARAVLIGLLAVNLAWLLVNLGRLPGVGGWGQTARWLAAAALVAVMALEALGYRTLSGHLLRGLLGMLVIAPLVWVVRRLLDELFGTLRDEQAPFTSRLRRRIRLARGRSLPGLGWLQFVVGLLYWLGLGLLVLRLWATAGAYSAALAWAQKPLGWGQWQVEPVRLGGALLAFGALQVAAAGVTMALRVMLGGNQRLDEGARDTLATLAGYVGFAIALLAALVLLRVNFAGLAVVAGALSVGIGFGLQNIVSNFVSGLILLVERPLRVGDWIEVGDLNGVVTRVSVRATEIQTWDRADVMVPNSDLIAKPLTNRTRFSRFGRVTVAVQVAYGSDLTRVSEVLLEEANAHERVIQQSGHTPFVVVMALADHGIALELRCVVEDVMSRESIRSQLYTAVERRLRVEGTEIPFPQRVVHVLPPPDQGRAAGGMESK